MIRPGERTATRQRRSGASVVSNARRNAHAGGDRAAVNALFETRNSNEEGAAGQIGAAVMVARENH
jgi:hypothetical protein